jgi:hypothetical protein
MLLSPAQRRAILALLLLVPAPSLGTAMAMWVAPGPVGKAVYFGCKAWLLALPVLWLLIVERRRLSWSPVRHGGMTVGIVSGLLIGAAILAAYWLFARPHIDAAPLLEIAGKNRFDRPAVYIAFTLYIMLVNSLLEEYVWRWFVLSRCEAFLPRAAAVGAAAVFFTIHHVVALKAYLAWDTTLLAAGGVCVGGLLWGWMYARYRSVWPGFVSHVLVDAAVFGIGWTLLFGRAPGP